MNFSDMLKRPLVVGLLGLVVGIFFGWIVLGWGLFPVEWKDAEVKLLRADLQEEYLRMTIDSFRVNVDEQLAMDRFNAIGPNGPALFNQIKAKPGKLDPGAVDQFRDILKKRNLYNPDAVLSSAGASSGSSSSSTITMVILAGVVIALVGVVGAVGFWLLRGGRRTGAATPAQQAADATRAVAKTDYVAMGEAPPVAQYVTTYVIGDDLFDDSFSIDSPSGEFLGECGVGISETIGVGDPKKVTAFEVWMFDKNDIQTVTKVLMSPHAFNDPNFRTKLEAKGELVPMQPQKQVVLETQTLQMIATVSDMQFGQGALPNGSYFDRLTLELAIWSKKQ
jgi:hypothetical protein